MGSARARLLGSRDSDRDERYKRLRRRELEVEGRRNG